MKNKIGIVLVLLVLCFAVYSQNWFLGLFACLILFMPKKKPIINQELGDAIYSHNFVLITTKPDGKSIIDWGLSTEYKPTEQLNQFMTFPTQQDCLHYWCLLPYNSLIKQTYSQFIPIIAVKTVATLEGTQLIIDERFTEWKKTNNYSNNRLPK